MILSYRSYSENKWEPVEFVTGLRNQNMMLTRVGALIIKCRPTWTSVVAFVLEYRRLFNFSRLGGNEMTNISSNLMNLKSSSERKDRD